MMKWLFRWILRHEISAEYDRGVRDGVNQYHHAPETAQWMVESYD